MLHLSQSFALCELTQPASGSDVQNLIFKPQY